MAPALWAWTFARLPAGEPLQTMWVAEDDAVLRGILAAQGFKPQPGAGLIELRCALEAPQLVVPAPLGFSLRCLGGEAELATRASASHAAFESRLRLDTYVERYRLYQRTDAKAKRP